MNRGAFDFVTKPIDFDDLNTTIDKSLLEYRSAIAAAEADMRLSSIQKELDIAKRTQEAALPSDFPQRDELFSDERFAELLRQVDNTSAPQTVRQVVREVSEFAASAEQSDNITIMAVRFE